MSKTRKRTVFSIKNELLLKSKEAALCAVQIFNNPNVTFKSEAFIVLMNIAWTYLMHAYYRDNNIEYRYFNLANKRRIFEKTSRGSYKYWNLERCLNEKCCPLEKSVIANLKFLIGIRHEIEHKGTDQIDDFISAKLQACCLNYNNALQNLFDQSISHHQPISIQFFSFGEEQIDSLKNKPNVPKNIIDFVADYENSLEENEKISPKYSYRVIYMRDNVNHENQADVAYRFIPETSYEGEQIHNVLFKNKQYTKLTQKDVVKKINTEGYKNFNIYQHQQFWKSKWENAKTRNQEARKFGELVVNNQWLWYEEKWLPEVRDYCSQRYS